MSDTRIKFLPWEKVPPFQYRIAVGDFHRHHRFQMIAVIDDSIIGYWRVEPRRGGELGSEYSRIALNWKRHGVARGLWFAGIAYWKPRKIVASIGTWSGACFLGSMQAFIEFQDKTKLDVRGLSPENSQFWCEEFWRCYSKTARDLFRVSKRWVSPEFTKLTAPKGKVLQ